jgi:hypothetical protein
LPWAFVIGTYVVAMGSLLAAFSGMESMKPALDRGSFIGGIFAVVFLFTAVAAPLLVIVGGTKLGEELFGITPPH